MARGVARYLVGSFVVLGLAACGKMMFAERDAWRHEAEVACLKTGQVKESASLARIQPITGPGICGADFPLKVAAIGEGSAIGFADGDAAAQAAARDEGEAGGAPVAAAVGGDVADARLAAELAPDHHGDIVEPAADIKIRE